MRKHPQLPEIEIHFANAKKSVFAPKELYSLLNEKREEWNIPLSYGHREFAGLLQNKIGLKNITLVSEKSKPISRLIRGKPSDLEIGASLIGGSYFCHQTAAMIHSLLEIAPHEIYLNKEQSEKHRPDNLTQEAIDRAFSNYPRSSSHKYQVFDQNDGVAYVVLCGKHSRNLGVERMEHPIAGRIQVTNLPRTLVDSVVRPQYVGSPSVLVGIFRKARPVLEIDKIIHVLKALNHIYPYHQAIGFLMQRANFPPRDYLKLKAMGLNFNFYLAHRLERPQYDPQWRLYYPADL
jgi:hypothetical protein